jgi:hypothetical protein
MKHKIAALALIPTIAALVVFAQNRRPDMSLQPDHKTLTGVWRGQMDGLPAVDLVLTDEGGSLSGAALFYFHFRKTVNDPYTSTPGLPEPLFNLHFDGTTLRFQVSHRRAHPPRTLSDAPIWFRLTLLDRDKATLVNETEPATEKGPGLVMTRSDY